MRERRFPFIIKEKGPLFFREGEKFYPYPIPETELYPEFPWPKSLCEHAPECPVSDDLTDISAAYCCPHALKNGCPLFLTHFDEFAELERITDVEIFEIGQDATKDWTEKDLDEIIKNFNSRVVDPPLVALGHGEEQDLLKKAGLPAAGWVESLKRKGKKLIADIADVPRLVAEAIKKKAYKYISAEIYPAFMHEGKNLGKVLRRIALLGADIPRIKSLREVLARYDDTGQESLWIGGIRMEDKDAKKDVRDEQKQKDDGKPEGKIEFAEELKKRDEEIKKLREETERLRKEREAEKRAAHLKDIDYFCERLKSETGFSAAIIDEGGLKDLLVLLDWQKPVKFSEEEEKTPYEKFTEVMMNIAKAAQEGKLVVPLGRLKEDDLPEVPKDVDPEAFELDRKIMKYAEEKKISYEQAFKELYLQKGGK